MMTNSNKAFAQYLEPTFFIDSDHAAVIDYAKKAAGDAGNDVDRAVKIFYAVRDEIYYDPYNVKMIPERLTASYALETKKGYCVTKAVLLAACGRALGIPSRLGHGDVKNHISTPKLKESMQTDIFYYHGFTEFYLKHKWVKATPAFNLALCEKFNIKPLEFNGEDNSLFHEYDQKGHRHMEYVRYHGHFADLPYDDILASCKKHYPRKRYEDSMTFAGDFHEDAKPMKDSKIDI